MRIEKFDSDKAEESMNTMPLTSSFQRLAQQNHWQVKKQVSCNLTWTSPYKSDYCLLDNVL